MIYKYHVSDINLRCSSSPETLGRLRDLNPKGIGWKYKCNAAGINDDRGT
jgi:hypothetical protein